MQYFLLNYVNDFVGAEVQELIWQAYQALTELLDSLKVDISQEKLVPPTTSLECLGVTFDSKTMTMEISATKMEDIRKEIQCWLYKTTATRREVESLIGKLQFLAKCIKAGRIFLSRLIISIKSMSRGKSYKVPQEVPLPGRGDAHRLTMVSH